MLQLVVSEVQTRFRKSNNGNKKGEPADHSTFSLPLRRQLLSRSSFQGGMLPHEERQTIIFQQYTRPFFIPNVPYPTCGGSKAWSKQITLLLATGGQPSTTSRFCIRVTRGPWAFRCLKTPGVVKLHFFLQHMSFYSFFFGNRVFVAI